MFGLWGGLLAGLRVDVGMEPRALAVRWPREGLRNLITAGLRTGLALGIGFGQAFGLAVGLAAGPAAGLSAGLAAVLFVGLPAALVVGFLKLVEFWSAPLATARAATPIAVYRSDRRRTLVVGLPAGLAAGLAAGLVAGPLVLQP